MFDVAIVGCGIIGAATAYELSRYDLKVALLERENDVAMGATKANSAIIHAGYDPSPGTLMAKLDVESVELAKELCGKLDIPHKQCGAMVLALSEEEIKTVEFLHKQALENGVKDTHILSKEEVLRLEPNVSENVVGALHAPTAMIVDPWEYTLALAETAVRNGVEIKFNSEVTDITATERGYEITIVATERTIEARFVINAAGLYSDDIHNMVAEPDFTVAPAKGEYWLLDKSEGTRINSVLFQCPSKAGKGVLVTPTVHGNLLVGPGNIPAGDKEDVSTTADELRYVRDTAMKSVPSIDFSAVIRSFSGNRAQTEHSDFIIREAAPRFIDLAGIKSPGLSSAPAIAKMAVEIISRDGTKLVEKAEFIDSRNRIRFNKLTPDEKAKLIENDPLYGRVICRCETVTEGEIRDALFSTIPPQSIDAVKRRTGAGMGRCQGGFCGPRILELLSTHYGIERTDVQQDRAGTFVLVSRTKEALSEEPEIQENVC
ncbi:MAG: NAD(P)/FAD-dependent oxidoreductase [Oscillospiraceae bacterium]|nr:NAD(P)/FAD-dependent oxidoreductase [Oscillospiraceae bacterium]